MFFEQSRVGSKKFRQSAILRQAERESIPYELMTLQELRDWIGDEFIFDMEIYRNYSLAGFMHVKSKKICYFEMTIGEAIDCDLLAYTMYSVVTIGFNNRNYDNLMVAAMIAGLDCETLKIISDAYILNEEKPPDLAKKFNFKLLHKINFYDLQEVAPLAESLKKYAARMHAERLQELPYGPHDDLTEEQRRHIKEYNFVDLRNTDLLRNELTEQIALRVEIGKMYGGIELRSKSDAQIAESVIVNEIQKITGRRPFKPEFDLSYQFCYHAPSYVQFQTPELQAILEKVQQCRITLGAAGQPLSDELPTLRPVINGKTYQMGLGGLHSTEKRQSLIGPLYDTDVESFYPKLILNNEWFPAHLGRAFLEVFDGLVARRLSAKAEAKKAKSEGDKLAEKAAKVIADSLKITINGTFGKLGSVWSTIYSPDLLVQVTVTGQLTLLMLIEACELRGIPVMSANTDGFVVLCQDNQRIEFQNLVKAFEQHTNLKTEETAYSQLHSRDVNSYIAVKTDGEVKVKGEYSEIGSTGNSRLSKNPEYLIVADAVIAFLTKGKPIQETINECQDVRRFVSVQNVKGGGHQNGLFLGKTVRWYYGTSSKGSINSVSSGITVGKSNGAVPIMDLPSMIPIDLDRNRYISYALDALSDIGYLRKQENLF